MPNAALATTGPDGTAGVCSPPDVFGRLGLVVGQPAAAYSALCGTMRHARADTPSKQANRRQAVPTSTTQTGTEQGTHKECAAKAGMIRAEESRWRSKIEGGPGREAVHRVRWSVRSPSCIKTRCSGSGCATPQHRHRPTRRRHTDIPPPPPPQHLRPDPIGLETGADQVGGLKVSRALGLHPPIQLGLVVRLQLERPARPSPATACSICSTAAAPLRRTPGLKARRVWAGALPPVTRPRLDGPPRTAAVPARRWPASACVGRIDDQPAPM
eukprot:scaffold2458_cov121-Isochrysis_galbana.AAC.6